MKKNVIVLIGLWSKECIEVKHFWENMKKKYDFNLKIIDVEFDEGIKLMDEYEISSVPATIIDDEVRFIGLPETKKAEDIFE